MQINTGDWIAQLLLFPYIKVKAAWVERSEGFGSTGKCVFWQTMINYQGPKFVEIEVLVNRGADISIFSQKSLI